jgi:small-conductance mechanosensitive channel
MYNTDETTDVEKHGARARDWILLALAALYTVSPVDIIPDIPVVGWIDDFLFIASAGVNVLQQEFGKTNAILSSILGVVKIITLLLGVIIVLLAVLAGTAIAKLIAG